VGSDAGEVQGDGDEPGQPEELGVERAERQVGQVQEQRDPEQDGGDDGGDDGLLEMVGEGGSLAAPGLAAASPGSQSETSCAQRPADTGRRCSFPEKRGRMAETPAEPVFRLIYRSHNRIPEVDRKAELGEIFSVSRSGNKKKGVTGALLTHGDWFVQALEGDEDTVRGLYEHIFRDDRHERVSVISTGQVDHRVFSRWAMARSPTTASPTSRCS
jgi:hypothetical protein